MKMQLSFSANDVVKHLGVSMGAALLRFNAESILYANEAAAFMFGYTKKREVYDVPSISLFADPFDWRKLIDMLPSRGVERDMRILFQRKDKTNFWGLLTCAFSTAGKYNCYDVVITSIDELVSHEHELEESRLLLEKVQAELDRFIYSASHDLRSPISSMMGIVHLMKMHPCAHDLPSNLNLLDQSLLKLDKVIEKLVSFSENSNGPLQSSRIDFAVLERKLRAGLKEHAHFSKIDFAYIQKGDQIFFSDPKRLLLILQHLIKNCYDFADLRKSASVVTVTINAQPDKFVAEIFDNGIGISKNQLDKVFTLFYRASEQSKGSGLGLFLVREAVIKLSGTIEIQSEYGVGTSVTVVIPNPAKGKLINKKKLLRHKHDLHTIKNNGKPFKY